MQCVFDYVHLNLHMSCIYVAAYVRIYMHGQILIAARGGKAPVEQVLMFYHLKTRHCMNTVHM